MTHTKYPPATILDAPPELAVLVEAFASAKGAPAYLAARHELIRWLRDKRGVVYLVGDRAVRYFHGDLRYGKPPRIPAEPQ